MQGDGDGETGGDSPSLLRLPQVYPRTRIVPRPAHPLEQQGRKRILLQSPRADLIGLPSLTSPAGRVDSYNPEGPRRDNWYASVLWDEWENGVRAHIDKLMARRWVGPGVGDSQGDAKTVPVID